MRKTVTIMLTLVMLASVLANISLVELQNEKMNDESSARSGPEAALVDVINPRETYEDPMSPGTYTHEILAGVDSNFVVTIQNTGDANITEMNIEVTVYLSGGSGNIAKDALGNNMTWTDSAICDDLMSCGVDNLPYGEYLNGGSYTVKDSSGADIVWTPPVGAYDVVVELDTTQDSIQSNNALSTFVMVVDWYDIDIDMVWDSNNDDHITGGGTHPFTMTVSLNGSTNWDARNVSISLLSTGSGLTSATGNSGADDLLAGATTMAGVLNSTALVWQNMSENVDINSSAFQTTGPRYELNWGDTYTYSGAVETDSGVTNGVYDIVATLNSYKIFAQKPDCAADETIIVDNGPDGQPGGGDDIEEIVTIYHMCDDGESVSDGNNANNEAELFGSIQNFHDIAVVDMTVLQGYGTGGVGAPSVLAQDGASLGVGFSRILVEVTHKGSTLTETYDWTVNIEITDTFGGGVVASYDVDECIEGLPAGMMPYNHMDLGDDGGAGGANLIGLACAQHDFGAGTTGGGQYDITATVSMVDPPSSGDMVSRNDDTTGSFMVFNNRPVASAAVESDGDIIVGDTITLIASSFDADDPDGQSLSYNWTRTTSNGSMDDMVFCDDQGMMCAIPVMDNWVGTLPVSVVVTDGYGLESEPASANVHVYNMIEATSTSASGAVMNYSLTYDSTQLFEVTITDASPIVEELLPDQGDIPYDSVVSLDYSNSLGTLGATASVLTQSMDLTFEGASDGTYSMWYGVSNQWEMIGNTLSTVDSTHVMLSADMSSRTNILGPGTIAVFEASGDQPTVPEAGVGSISAVSQAGGSVVISWTADGVMVEGDSFEVCIDSCPNPIVLDRTVTTYTMAGATHGQSYSVTVKVVNSAGANGVFGSATIVADTQVDPNTEAEGLTFTASGDDIVVAWTAGDASDVVAWKVCWDTTTFNANNMALETMTCDVTTDATTSFTIAKSSAPGDHNIHVAVGGVDSVGNEESNNAMNSYSYTIEGSTGDGTGTVGDTVEDGGVPGWAWGAIIGIVVLAFVVGAFILSRGNEGDDGKEWDY